MTTTKRRAAARKAADTRSRNKRREVARVVVGKQREFVLTHRRVRTGVVTTVRLAPGWQMVHR